MPSLSLYIPRGNNGDSSNLDNWYVLENKEYFLYPFYNDETLPKMCLFSFLTLSEGEITIADSYIFG